MGDEWQAVGAIIAAVVSAVALLKVSRIDNQDKIRRALWSMETYFLVLGAYLAEHTAENRAKYKAFYLVCSFYLDEALRATLCEIDQFLKNEAWDEAEEKAFQLVNDFRAAYSMNKYLPKRKASVVLRELKRKIAALWNKR